MPENPKVLVACPTYSGMSYCLHKFIERIKNLTYNNREVLIVDNSETEEFFKELENIKGIEVLRDNTEEKNKLFRLVSSRNKILDYATENGYDYILMLDQDVIPPINVIEELLSCKKDLVIGLYFNYFKSSGDIKILPVAWKSLNEQEFSEIKSKINLPDSVKSQEDMPRHLTEEEVKSGELMQVFHPSAGCLLMSRPIFTKIRYGAKISSEGKLIEGEDIHLIRQAKENGFQPFCFTKVLCDHLVAGKYENDGNSAKHPLYK